MLTWGGSILPRMWFRRKHEKTPQETLVDAIIQEGLETRKFRAEAEAAQRQLELKKIELEMEHIEALGEERRKDLAEKEKIRVARQANAAAMRELRGRRKAAAQTPEGQPGGCRVCINPMQHDLTSAEIIWHGQGHREQ